MTAVDAAGVERSAVRYSVEAGCATITLDRPSRRNAFDRAMVDELAEALRRARDDEAVRVVVLTGTGSAFCAGGDLDAIGANATVDTQQDFLVDHVHLVPRALRDLDKPVVARINGAAVGAGLDIALWCDFRIAAVDAPLGEAYINVGLVAGDGGAYLLPRIVGLPTALDLLLTGRIVSGREAAEIGLVHRAVPASDLDEAVAELVARLASRPPRALGIMKRLVHQSAEADWVTALELAAAQVALLSAGDEHRRVIADLRAPADSGERG